jgi:hypothetical protein
MDTAKTGSARASRFLRMRPRLDTETADEMAATAIYRAARC